MNYLYIIEIVLILTSLISGFIVSLRYLVQFQRKIDRLILLNSINAQRVRELEKFLEKSSDFQVKKRPDKDVLSESTDFI